MTNAERCDTIFCMYERKDRFGKQEDLACAHCRNATMHTIRYSYETSWNLPDVALGGTLHDFLNCNGCGEGTYRRNSWSSEDQDRSIRLYPVRLENTRETKQFPNVPWESKLTRIYRQTVAAFNEDLMTLAGAGVRLLIEGICIEKNVADGPIFDQTTGVQVINRKNNQPVRRDNLEGRINGLAEKDLISRQQCKYLHELRFLGNDAAHQLDIPEPVIVGHAIDIVESIFEQLYEQPEKAAEIAARIRPPKS